MKDRPEGDAAASAGTQCNWIAENIWGPLSDFWNTKTVSVNPHRFTGMPDSITFPQISTCDTTTGQMVSRQGTPVEHYSKESLRYQPPR